MRPACCVCDSFTVIPYSPIRRHRGGTVDLIRDSFLVLGRASLGAAIGFGIGWLTQGDKHSRWVAGWLFFGYAAGMATMWPSWGSMLAALFLLIPCVLGTVSGWYVAVATLRDREDWYFRAWGLGGFVLFFHVFAFAAMAIVRSG